MIGYELSKQHKATQTLLSTCSSFDLRVLSVTFNYLLSPHASRDSERKVERGRKEEGGTDAETSSGIERSEASVT